MFAATRFTAEKLIAIPITLALVAITCGVLVPWFARRKVRRRTGGGRRAAPGATAPAPKRGTARLKRLAQLPSLSGLLGADGRLSTSKTVAALWTLVVAYVVVALILIWPDKKWDDALKNLWPTYLLLLGGPYASLVLAKAAVSTRVQSGSLQKPQGDGVPRLSDLVGDDSGATDLFDAQFVLFNLIAIIFVLVAFARMTLVIGFPDVPVGLLTLTGGPAAVYVANKALSGNGLVLFSVFPSLVRAGETFTVYGQNFAPASGSGPAPPTTSTTSTTTTGEAAANGAPAAATNPPAATTQPADATGAPTVELDGDALEVKTWTNATIVAVAKAPQVNSGGRLGISVGTEGGQRAFLPDALAVMIDPVVLGLDKGYAAVGAKVLLSGRWSGLAGLSLVVLVDGLAAPIDGQPVLGASLSFVVPTLPAPLPRTVEVKLVAGAETSNAVPLQVGPAV